MKNFIFTSVLILSMFRIYAQSPLTPLSNYLKTIETKNAYIASKDTILLSSSGFDLFLKRRIAYCMSADGSVSLFHNYVFADFSDSRFSFGRNIGYHTKKDELLNHVWSFGFSADGDDDKKFSSIYEKGKFKGNISFDAKFTFFFGRSLYHGYKYSQKQKKKSSGKLFSTVEKRNTQKNLMDGVRTQAFNDINEKFKKDSTNFSKIFDSISDTGGQYKKDILDHFIDSKREEYKKLYTEAEVNSLEKYNSYNAIRACWATISVNVPITILR